jgi:hypothetical protein
VLGGDSASDLAVAHHSQVSVPGHAAHDGGDELVAFGDLQNLFYLLGLDNG